jgi:hypothetical protein
MRGTPSRYVSMEHSVSTSCPGRVTNHCSAYRGRQRWRTPNLVLRSEAGTDDVVARGHALDAVASQIRCRQATETNGSGRLERRKMMDTGMRLVRGQEEGLAGLKDDVVQEEEAEVSYITCGVDQRGEGGAAHRATRAPGNSAWTRSRRRSSGVLSCFSCRRETSAASSRLTLSAGAVISAVKRPRSAAFFSAGSAPSYQRRSASTTLRAEVRT